MTARNRFSSNTPAMQKSQAFSWTKETGDAFTDTDKLQPIATTSRDRTKEFQAILKSFKPSKANGNVSREKTMSPLQNRSAFSKHAKHIGQDLAKTYEKLEKLTLLCKKRTLFNDRPVEIQELTYIIKQDITSLKRGIQKLEDFRATSETATKKDARKHNSSIVKTLRSKLAGMSENFKSVLEIRRENMKQQQMRKDQFSSSNLTSLMPTSAGQGGSLLLMDEQRSNNSSQSVSVSMDERPSTSQQHQALDLVEKQDDYISERAETMETIESTIVELGNIFQQLATVVKEQEEQVMRIDASVEESDLNIQAAHSEILKYFQGITSNRWLMVKVFLTLIVFFIVFVVFFA